MKSALESRSSEVATFMAQQSEAIGRNGGPNSLLGAVNKEGSHFSTVTARYWICQLADFQIATLPDVRFTEVCQTLDVCINADFCSYFFCALVKIYKICTL